MIILGNVNSKALPNQAHEPRKIKNIGKQSKYQCSRRKTSIKRRIYSKAGITNENTVFNASKA